jgi:Ca2+-binding EF-hand superfamily protein
MTLSKRILGAASVLALSMGTAWAGGGHHSQQSSGSSMSPPSEQISFERLDVNGDGQVSRAELKGGVAGMTSDSPGASAGSSQQAESSQGSGESGPLAKFDSADRDKDGQLSRSEFETLAASGAGSLEKGS